MSNKQAIEIEKLFIHCSTIGFHRSDASKATWPLISLGFDDEVSGTLAHNALADWAKEDELMIALQDRGEYLDALLIQTGSYQVATIKQLSFSRTCFLDFVSHEPQDRPVLMNHCMNPCEKNGDAVSGRETKSLILFRYIVVNSESSAV